MSWERIWVLLRTSFDAGEIENWNLLSNTVVFLNDIVNVIVINI